MRLRLFMKTFAPQLKGKRSFGPIAVTSLALAGAFAFGLCAPAHAAVKGQSLSVQIVPTIGQPSGKGWQGNGFFSFATGTTSIFLHMDCPSAFPVVHNGAFAFNGTGQTSDVYLSYNGPRIDESPPSYIEWGWHFYWPGGSPAGTTALFSVECYRGM